MKRLITLLAFVLMLPTAAQAWWDKDWTVRKQVTLDTQAAAIAAETGSTVVLVRLSTGNFDFLAAKEDGSDIRFVAEDDATPLKFHIERFDKINELAFIWVQVPKLAASNKTQHIWLYAGNEKAPATADSKTTYDDSHLMVLHLSETQGVPQDASVNATAAQGNVSYITGGLIGGAARLGGDGGVVASSPALQAAKEFTFSAWVKPTQADGELLDLGNVSLKLVAGVPVLTVGGVPTKASEALPMNAWHHIAVVAGQGVTLYVNGKPVANASGAAVITANVRVGGSLVGELDEVQIATAARSAGWVAVQVESQGQAGRLVKVGEEQSSDGGEETGYLMVTLKNLTIDGWVVIVLCVLMLIYAIYVMINKLAMISRQSRSNPLFSDAFDQLSKQLSTLGNSAQAHAKHLDALAQQTATYQDSSLHRIYQVGVREIKFRFDQAEAIHTANGSTSQGMPIISERAMLAVRSSLDAQMVRERQKLDSQMVMLTIAISGGPFLGLLGTVVGVMITFAAVAVAGDVNVNAIAPGIAAALAATVAGLGVAIPALFGYNYLQTKIKTIGADMTVFVDEFVTKMSETYGD
jgi:biopolymer transport protein ExbB